MKIKHIVIATLLVGSLLLTGCNNNNEVEDPNKAIQNIASENFTKYMETYGLQNLKEITEDKELSETENVLYKFLVALTSKDYPTAMRLSNYGNSPFLTEEDFQNGLSLNKDTKYNYASIASKDLKKGVKLSVTPVPDVSNIMFTAVLLEDTYEYNGALVKIGDEWRVAITGLQECIFEVPTNQKLYINDIEADEFCKVGTQDNKDIYKVNLLNDATYTTTGNCISKMLSGNIGDSDKDITFHIVCTDEEINEFIKWEKEFYTNMYQAAFNGEDLSTYFSSGELMKAAQDAIEEQKSKNISDIVITDLFPTKHLDSPIKKIDNNTIEASVTIVFSYKYIDKIGKLHTKDGISDTRTKAVFIRADENSSWKMSQMLSSDPILTNSKFGAI